jgi:hypothetical protein
MPRLTPLLLLLATFALGCVNAPNPPNPSFPVTFDQADTALSEMAAAPRPLQRPLVVIGGFWDFNVTSPIYRHHFRRLTSDDRIVCVSVGFCGSFDECRRKVIDAVDAAFPSDDPDWTTEVDVVGASLGGLVGRVAAAPSPDPARPRRLKVARLFTVASPHAGAVMASMFGFTSYHRDMTPGSPFLTSLADADRSAGYELYPYVRLGDGIVGDANAAPPDQTPLWLANPPLHLAHAGAIMDARILADIARRLRGETPFSTLPPAPLPADASH